MKNQHRKLQTVCFAFLAALLVSGSGAQEPGANTTFLEQLTSSYERALGLQTTEFVKEAFILKTRYLEALERLQRFYQEGGNTDGAIAVKAERDRIAALEGLGEAAVEPSELKRFEEIRSTFEKSADPLREKFEEVLADLAETRNKALEDQIARSTKAGKIDEAIILKAQLEEWRGEEVYDPEERPPRNADEVYACLTDTTWTYVEDGGRPQYMRFYPERYIVTMWQEDKSRTFGQLDYRIDKDLNVIWAYAGQEIRMEFDKEFRNYESFKHETNLPHRVGEFLHRGPTLLPE